MTLKNIDKKLGKTSAELLSNAQSHLFEAMRTDDEHVQEEAMQAFSEGIAATVNAEMALRQDEINDDAILAARNLRKPMTSKERKFFAEAVEKQTITGLSSQFPETIVEDVYRNLVETHPVIGMIDMQHGSVKTKFIYGDATKKRAFWDIIPSDIKQILLDGFKSLDISVSKLSGFVALPKGYFELGPTWLASYVTTFLQEVMAVSLEEAIINGDGKLKPLGMMRKLSGDSGGVYPEKDKVELSDLTPLELAKIRGALAKSKTDRGGSVAVLVNPETYWAKLYPKLAYQQQTGQWVVTQLPTGEQIIQTHAVPADVMVFGVLKNYLLVVASNIELKKYEETLAIEDMDLYIAKMFAKGIAKNENAFFVADISGVAGATLATLEGAAAIKAEDTINPLPGV